MSSKNPKRPTETPIYTGGGARAVRIGAMDELRRSVLTALLWENIAYASGKGRAKEIADLVLQCPPGEVCDLAIEAREQMHLRHMPLYLMACLCEVHSLRLKTGLKDQRHFMEAKLIEATLAAVVQRPDELSEFLAIYWDGKTNEKKRPHPLSRAAKRGLQTAFQKFNEYSLAKFNRDKGITLKDVLRIVHPVPRDAEQSALWRRLRDGELASPETWENRLSRGEDAKTVWEEMLKADQLGGLAFLRNLRNMTEAKVDRDLILERFKGSFARVLPFRFLAAANHAPLLEAQIETTMFRSIAEMPKLDGTTVLIVDVSGSMGAGLSGKSDMNRMDVAASLAMIVRELAEDPIIIATAGSDLRRTHKTELLPPRRGMAMKEAIHKAHQSLGGGGIFLVQCMDAAKEIVGRDVRRVIVLTDEQDCDTKLKPAAARTFGQFNYLINISNEKNGVGYGQQWTAHIDGWSERVFDFIQSCEAQQRQLVVQ